MGEHEPELSIRATAPAQEARATPPRARYGELAAGTVLGGRHEILRRLGGGGMGAVYEAVQHPLDRRVAVKVLSPLLATDPDARRRFADEGRVASRVRHPNVVEVIDQGVEGETPYLVMELLEGETLAARIERVGRFEPEAAVALLAPMLRALAFVHARGVVHRDLKPENLFLARDGDLEDVPRILDLGIAAAVGDAALRATATGVMLGTPAYMAPEQVRSARDAGPAADQYAMACVLYEMLSGHVPIEADSVQGILGAKLVCDPTPLSRHRAALPPALDAAVMRALDRDPAARFPDALAFLAALEAALRAPEAPRAEPAPEAPAPKPRPRSPLPVAGAVAALTAALVLAWIAARAPRPAAAVTPTARPAAPVPAALAPAMTSPPPRAEAPVAVPAADVPVAQAPARQRVTHRPRPTPAPGRLQMDPANPLRGARP